MTIQTEEHIIYALIKESHRDIDDFIDGNLGDRIENFSHYNLIENFDLTQLDKDEWWVDTDLVSDYEKEIKDEGISTMPLIVIEDNHSLIDGIHRLNAMLNCGITIANVFIGTNIKKDNLNLCTVVTR